MCLWYIILYMPTVLFGFFLFQSRHLGTIVLDHVSRAVCQYRMWWKSHACKLELCVSSLAHLPDDKVLDVFLFVTSEYLPLNDFGGINIWCPSSQ